jgi:hypothetical protein
MSSDAHLNIARGAIAAVAARFPHLSMVEDVGVPVELSITLPVQPGLRQKVWLCLQNMDELHFSVGHFLLEWFPCSKPSRVSDYVDAVSGYLSGTYRILEFYRGKRCVKAQLQAPDSGSWRAVGTWRTLWSAIPWKDSIVELRNA